MDPKRCNEAMTQEIFSSVGGSCCSFCYECKMVVAQISSGWFQVFFIFNPTWVDDPI